MFSNPLACCRNVAFTILGLLLAISLASNAFGQGKNRNLKADSNVEDSLRRIESKLDRLQASLDKLNSRAGDLSKVTIRVATQDGKPLAGFRTELRLMAESGRTTRANGVSNKAGVAIERYLPYGEYDLDLSAGGWKADFDDVIVEVGKPLDLTVHAPDPAEYGTLKIQSALKKEMFQGLPFGELRRLHGAGSFSLKVTPEPGETEVESYPKLGDGVEQIVVPLEIEAELDLEQPGLGNTATWYWEDQHAHSREQLVLVGDRIAKIGFAGTDTSSIGEDVGYFQPVNDDYRLKYLPLENLTYIGREYSIEAPAGKLQLRLRNPYGRLSKAALQSLKINVDAVDSVWIDTNLADDSDWIAGIIATDSWKRSDHMFVILERTIELPANETHSIVVPSP